MDLSKETDKSIKMQLSNIKSTKKNTWAFLNPEQQQTFLDYEKCLKAELKKRNELKKIKENNEGPFDLFINQYIEMNPLSGNINYGTTKLVSYKQARFFANKLRQAVKKHNLQKDMWDNKIESLLNADFYLTNESPKTSTAYLSIRVTYGGANGNSLEIMAGKKAQKMLGIKCGSGMAMDRV